MQHGLHATYTRLLVAWWYVGVVLPPGVVPSLVTSSFGLLYLKRVALPCLTPSHPSMRKCLDRSCSSTSASMDDVFVGPIRLAYKALHYHWYWPWSRYLPLVGWLTLCTSWQRWATRCRSNGSMAFYLLLKRLWEPGFWAMHQVVRA